MEAIHRQLVLITATVWIISSISFEAFSNSDLVRGERGIHAREGSEHYCTMENDGDCCEEQFHCGDGTCLPPSWQCDGSKDCPGGQDEKDDCEDLDFKCDDGHSIPMTSLCDGDSDCTHGEDEGEMCKVPKRCPDFKCVDESECFSRDELCDGINHCNDTSDEAGCMYHRTTDCFSCDQGSKCISNIWLCDEIVDCDDLTDESHALCPPVQDRCWRGSFLCQHRLFCIRQEYRCDEVNDCGDESDELSCKDIVYWADNGGWTAWSSWTECSTSCGPGTRSRHRRCFPQVQCSGPEEETELCEIFPCGGNAENSVCGIRHISGHTPSVATRIIGGVESVAGSWPWQVQLWFKSGQRRRDLVCGGTLINEMTVITAAHCFFHNRGSQRSRWRVHFGKFKSKKTLAANSGELSRKVSNIIRYDSLNALSVWHDIAVLILENPITEFTEKISPACVDKNNIDTTDENLLCYATGWGVTQILTGRRATFLQEAELPIISHHICNQEEVYQNSIEGDMFCAGYLEGQIDACKGDSGGPYVCLHTEEDRWFLVGITSWGHGCALPNKPGVYTNVSYYAQWIEYVIEKHAVPVR